MVEVGDLVSVVNPLWTEPSPPERGQLFVIVEWNQGRGWFSAYPLDRPRPGPEIEFHEVPYHALFPEEIAVVVKRWDLLMGGS